MKKTNCHHIIFILISFVHQQLYATPYPPLTKINIDQGLSNSSVRCIYQDRKGFMWFGTYDGLNRYDGYSFKIFRNNFKNPASLVNNWINVINEDKNGNIWIGTRQGLCVYKYLSNHFSPMYYQLPGNKTETVTAVIKDIERDDKGNMFIGTVNMGLLFCPDGDSISYQVPLNNVNRNAQKYEVPAIKIDSDKRVWVSVRDRGLFFFDYKSKTLKLINTGITSINCLETEATFLWVGTNNGLSRYNIAMNSYDKVYQEAAGKLSYRDVVALTLDRSKKLWIATNGGGVNILHITTDSLEYLSAGNNSRSLSSGSVYAICEDKESRKWIGTLRGGINILDPHKERFQTVVAEPASANTLISNYILSFYEDSEEKLWVGTDGEGLSIWDRKQNMFTNFRHVPNDPGSLSDNYITAIKESYNQDIWIATYRGNINRYNKRTRSFEHYKFVDPVKPEVKLAPLTYSIHED